MFNIEEYQFDLPEDLIAQVPSSVRDGSRLLHVKCLQASFSDHFFFDLPQLLQPGDLLVVNNTKVVPARLFGRKESGGHIEILVLDQGDIGRDRSQTRWCLFRSSKRPRIGTRLLFDKKLVGQVKALGENGLVEIAFQGNSIDSHLEENGAMPLPPYIKRPPADTHRELDKERYQTIFSREKGAIASPTAGLHFTGSLVKDLKETEIEIVEVTLHVGHGTFRPVRSVDIREHKLGEERFYVSPETALAVRRAKKGGRRVIAVGTTVVRTLESVFSENGEICYGRGKTDLMITPGYRFRVIDGMITNFHLPGSSLLFLVSALAGLELIRKAYKWAIERRYRFYSYGDAMLIL